MKRVTSYPAPPLCDVNLGKHSIIHPTSGETFQIVKTVSIRNVSIVLSVMWANSKSKGDAKQYSSIYDLQTNVSVWLQAHTDTVIVMQFLYSSGPQALCAILNQP